MAQNSAGGSGGASRYRSDVATKLDNNENIGIDKVKFQSEIKRATKKLEIMTEYINEIGFLKNKL